MTPRLTATNLEFPVVETRPGQIGLLGDPAMSTLMFAEGKQLSPQHINQHLLAFNLSSEGAETSALEFLTGESSETGKA